ncbi:MAG: hypothetical protein M1834_001281 [Cirrosporium novae-zelandiae]|nr:MAG: hypothetical protein M1834_001281 [Cirrosporium novae-zelandiae]
MMREVTHLRGNLFGENPAILTDLHNLAGILYDQNKLDEAEELYRGVFSLGGDLFGKDAPHTLISLYCLICTLKRRGKYEEIKELQRQALEGVTMRPETDHWIRKELTIILNDMPWSRISSSSSNNIDDLEDSNDEENYDEDSDGEDSDGEYSDEENYDEEDRNDKDDDDDE